MASQPEVEDMTCSYLDGSPHFSLNIQAEQLRWISGWTFPRVQRESGGRWRVGVSARTRRNSPGKAISYDGQWRRGSAGPRVTRWGFLRWVRGFVPRDMSPLRTVRRSGSWQGRGGGCHGECRRLNGGAPRWGGGGGGGEGGGGGGGVTVIYVNYTTLVNKHPLTGITPPGWDRQPWANRDR